jgi:hypothetical protein
VISSAWVWPNVLDDIVSSNGLSQAFGSSNDVLDTWPRALMLTTHTRAFCFLVTCGFFQRFLKFGLIALQEGGSSRQAIVKQVGADFGVDNPTLIAKALKTGVCGAC